MTNTEEEGGYWNTGGPKVYSEDDLTSAVEVGVLPVETARHIRRHVAGLHAIPPADEEYFRLISGFNDIFVVIACTLLLVAVGGIFGTAAKGAGAVAVAVASWGLAEYFVRKRRMALPAILLLLGFVGGVATAVFLTLNDGYRSTEKISFIVASIAAVMAALLHWYRFKVPITVACGAGSAVSMVLFILLFIFPGLKDHLALITGIGGIAVFLFAMKWDSQDIVRQTKRSDVAFWLHLLSAPLLVHPLFVSIGIFGKDVSLIQALSVVGIYVAIAFISLCIDRRALMVSSLAYVVYALSTLFKDYGKISQDFLVAALVISTALLLLSAGWQAARSVILRCLPQSAQRTLPPVRR